MVPQDGADVAASSRVQACVLSASAVWPVSALQGLHWEWALCNSTCCSPGFSQTCSVRKVLF